MVAQRILPLLLFLFMLLGIAFSANAEQVEEFGDYRVHYTPCFTLLTPNRQHMT